MGSHHFSLHICIPNLESGLYYWRMTLHEACEKDSQLLLCWFPLGLSEDERLGLIAGTAPQSPLAHAVQLAHQGELIEARERLAAHYLRGPERVRLELLDAAVTHLQGEHAAARARVWKLLPELCLDQHGESMAHLMIASCSLTLQETSLALQASRQAVDLTTRGRRETLRIPSLLFLACAFRQQGDMPRSLSLARQALRLARSPLERYAAHLTLARLLLPHEPYQAFQLLEAARLAAPSPAYAAEAQRLSDWAFTSLKWAQPIPTPQPASVHLTFLYGPALVLNGSRLDAGRHPRPILLLAYLLEYPNCSLASAAEALLPEGAGGRVQHSDERRRVARIRQQVSAARQLLSDPGAVICHSGLLRLSEHYLWTTDLGEARAANWKPPMQLQCDWTEELFNTPWQVHG